MGAAVSRRVGGGTGGNTARRFGRRELPLPGYREKPPKNGSGVKNVLQRFVEIAEPVPETKMLDAWNARKPLTAGNAS